MSAEGKADKERSASTARTHLNALFNDLVAQNVKLSLKVYKVECDKKEECPLYKIAIKISDIVDKLNDLS